MISLADSLILNQSRIIDEWKNSVFESLDVYNQLLKIETTNISEFMSIQLHYLANVNKELEEALSKVKILKALLPICMHCKRIRKDDNS